MQYGNSIWAIISIFIILIISTKSYHTDGEYFCANHTEQCAIALALPCCDLDDKCTRIGWGALQRELRCLKEAYLEDHCETTLDCHKVNHAECSKEKKCKCHSNFIAVGNSKCISTLNGFCTKDSNCLTQNSTCKDSQCKCKFNFRPTSDNQCVPKKLFKFCRKDKDCEDIIHAKCNNDYECVCRPNNVAVNDSVCLPKIDAFCWKNESCAAENSVCINNTCSCKPGYKNIQNIQCARTYLEMPCQHDIECADIRSSECYMNSNCACKDNAMKLNDTFCAPLLGGLCSNDKECIPDNSVCVNNRCQCETNFFSLAHYKCILLPLGESCSSNIDCIDTRHRECSKNGQCVCRPNVMSINESICLSIINGFCFDDDECYSENSYCSDHRCQCKPGFLTISNDRCTEKHLATRCHDNDDCKHLMYGECSEEGKCLCKLHTILFNQKCVPILGGYCDRNDECFAGNSECVNHRCECETQFFPSSRYHCQRATYHS